MRVLSKREPFRYFQFLDPDPINWYLFLFLVYVRIFHNCWNCTFVFLFKVQDPFLQKRSTHTELSFHVNVSLDDNWRIRSRHFFQKQFFLFAFGYLIWQMWHKSLLFCRGIYEKDFFKNPAWVVFLSGWIFTLALLQFILNVTFLETGKNLLLNTKKEIYSQKYW